MRVLLQRVQNAAVTVDSREIGKIGRGFLLLVGFTTGDTLTEVEYLAKKIAKLRVFEDETGKLNLDLKQIEGAILSVSQFTLYADTKKGNRPSFTKALAPAEAENLYEAFNEKLRQAGFAVATGKFGAEMQVSLVNDGPVTICLEKEAS
ncbi:MAG: D-aminoacyl-tRNA deacylase [Enterococcaceae bacterium]|jgi:D-tyrosyl-tRNA(Tyr) deacylase|nr:D-aminoacyl-tRNA deacylase [Enterococcaceae bacterium]MCI1919431.1 D-aminoacyl-tRNA deacylase [Enterococcaceae bacterium]